MVTIQLALVIGTVVEQVTLEVGLSAAATKARADLRVLVP
jgi:hypothetical protein